MQSAKAIEYTISMTRPNHQKYRWRYILWSCLLLVSLGALAFWECPSRSGSAEIRLVATIHGAPKSSKVTIWSGPKARVQGIESSTNPSRELNGKIDERIILPVAYRRWIGIIIPRKTHDLIVIKVTPPTGAPRYLSLPFSQDWMLGSLKPGSRMPIRLSADWDGLWENYDTPIVATNQPRK